MHTRKRSDTAAARNPGGPWSGPVRRFGNRRNFGFGKQAAYAVRAALRDKHRSYATVRSYAQRFEHFIAFMKAADLRRLDFVDGDLYAAYADHLLESVYAETLSHSYAVNLLSTANAVFEALRRDRALWIAPASVLGSRHYVRTEPPLGLDAAGVAALAGELRADGHPRVAALAELCRAFGLRFREASLLPLADALRDAQRQGFIDVRLGTKNGRGRHVERLVPASGHDIAVLERAVEGAAGSRNLIPEEWQYVAWYYHAHRHYRPSAQRANLSPRFHELRAAYCCVRYEHLTGYPAPCVAGKRMAPKPVHREASEVLTRELGHSRIEILPSYYGSSR
jgi:hypothetical protein